jgi:hypothetical protein
LSRVRYVKRGEFVTIAPGEKFGLQCCDCGLVHDVVIRRAPMESIQIAFWRNPRKTSARRRARKSNPTNQENKS